MRLNGRRIVLVIGWTGLATGIAFLSLAVGFGIYEVSFLARSADTPGVVIANVKRPADSGWPTPVADGPAFCPQVRYVTGDGTIRVMTSSSCSSPPAFAVGVKVRIHYLRAHPDDGQIASLWQTWGFVFAFAIASALTLSIGIVALRRLRERGFSLDPFTVWN